MVERSRDQDTFEKSETPELPFRAMPSRSSRTELPKEGHVRHTPFTAVGHSFQKDLLPAIAPMIFVVLIYTRVDNQACAGLLAIHAKRVPAEEETRGSIATVRSRASLSSLTDSVASRTDGARPGDRTTSSRRFFRESPREPLVGWITQASMVRPGMRESDFSLAVSMALFSFCYRTGSV